MNLTHYRYGSPGHEFALSIGVARYVPRGVPRENWRRLGYFDVWMPLLAPSRELLAAFRKSEFDFPIFAQRYRKEMKSAEPQQVIALLAATCQVTPIRVGCFCKDDTRCHRSILVELIATAAQKLPPAAEPLRPFASPPCSMPEIED